LLPSVAPCFSLALLDKSGYRYCPTGKRGAANPAVGAQTAPDYARTMAIGRRNCGAPGRESGRDLKMAYPEQMPAHEVGRLWKFLASEVDAWVKGGKSAQVKPSK